MAQQTRIAILGGGLAGCTLANGLLRYPHIRFDVFEGKDSFGERGAAVGLNVNAQKALSAARLDAVKLMKDSGAVQVTSTRCLVAHGEHAGKPILEIPGGVHIVDRASYLTQLLKDLPKERLHPNKKLVAIQQTPGQPLVLRFHDGSEFSADAVIGCDGIRSKTREIILGANHPAVPPVFGGYWDARGALTTDQAVARFGTKFFDPREPTQLALVGDGAFMLFGPTEDGKKYNAIVSGAAGSEWDPSAWKMDLSRDLLEDKFSCWDADFRKGVLDCIMGEDTGTGIMFSHWESAEAPTYRSGRICMLGDAAHAPTPWFGQGASQATEDCAVLSRLFGAMAKTDEIELVLEAFEKNRRGRPEFVVRRARDIGKLLTGQMGLDPGRLENLHAASWWDYVEKVDMERECMYALDLFEKFKVGERA